MSAHRERGLFTQSDYYCEQSIRINTAVDSAGAVVLHSATRILCYGVRSTVHFALLWKSLYCHDNSGQL